MSFWEIYAMKKFAAILALLMVLCLAARDDTNNTNITDNVGDTTVS